VRDIQATEAIERRTIDLMNPCGDRTSDNQGPRLDAARFEPDRKEPTGRSGRHHEAKMAGRRPENAGFDVADEYTWWRGHLKR
jgi:hypothetical protein